MRLTSLITLIGATRLTTIWGQQTSMSSMVTNGDQVTTMASLPIGGDFTTLTSKHHPVRRRSPHLPTPHPSLSSIAYILKLAITTGPPYPYQGPWEMVWSVCKVLYRIHRFQFRQTIILLFLRIEVDTWRGSCGHVDQWRCGSYFCFRSFLGAWYVQKQFSYSLPFFSCDGWRLMFTCWFAE